MWLNMNFLPRDRPRSIISQACGRFRGPTEEAKFSAFAEPLANSGCLLGACEPLLPSGSAINPPAPGALERKLGLSGAPHSSQYCEPSRFSVLHLSQLIIYS